MTIDQLLEAADKASPGPWHVSGEGIYRENGLCSIARIGNAMSPFAGVEEANATLMAGAPQLAVEVRRLREENETGKTMYAELWTNSVQMHKERLKARERERVLVEALRFYADSEWNDDYPGGITVHVIDKMWLDTGDRARAALKAVKE